MADIFPPSSLHSHHSAPLPFSLYFLSLAFPPPSHTHMADFTKENDTHVRLTRAATAKKRAAAAEPLPCPVAKKHRVVLGELRNLRNLPVLERAQPKLQPKPKAKRRSKPGEPPTAVDEPQVDDPQLCTPYATDIDRYLRFMEVEAGRRPRRDYMEAIQKDVTAGMRAILVDWMVEVAEEYKLTPDTLYLSVSYVDRFLSHNAIGRQRLQLLGVTCMLIASKYEEIKPPHVEDFCYITDNTYTKQEMLTMETDVLKFLKFELGNPTIKTFLRRFTRTGVDSQSRTLQLELLCSYLAESSLVDYGCLRFLPSMIAASSVFLAKFTLNPEAHPWNSTLHKYTGYRPCQLKDCILVIHDLQLNRKGSTLVAVRDKYNQHKFKFVPKLSSPQEIPSIYFEDINIQQTIAGGNVLRL